MKSDFDIDDFLRAERAAPQAAEDQKDAARDRLEIVLGPLAAVGTVPFAGGPSTPSASTPSLLQTLGRYKSSIFLVSGFAIGLTTHAALDRAKSRETSSAATSQNVVAPITSASPAPSASAAVIERNVEALPLAPLAPTASSQTNNAAPSSSRSDTHAKSDLAAESVLLETARTALERNEPEHALSALDRHRQRFPNGQLTEERESLTIYALAAEGKMDEARTKTAAFHHAFPNSLQGASLDTLTATP